MRPRAELPTTDDVVLPPRARLPCARVALAGPGASVAETLRVADTWFDLVRRAFGFTVGGDWPGVPSASLTGLTLLDGRVGDLGAVGSPDKAVGFQRVEEGVDLPEPAGDSVVERRRTTSIGVSDTRGGADDAAAVSPGRGGTGFNKPCVLCC